MDEHGHFTEDDLQRAQHARDNAEVRGYVQRDCVHGKRNCTVCCWVDGLAEEYWQQFPPTGYHSNLAINAEVSAEALEAETLMAEHEGPQPGPPAPPDESLVDIARKAREVADALACRPCPDVPVPAPPAEDKSRLSRLATLLRSCPASGGFCFVFPMDAIRASRRDCEAMLETFEAAMLDALAQPIERCSLKHECRNDGSLTTKDIVSGPRCYAAMVTDPAGDWVPYGHHKATAIGLASALGHIADLCSAIETQSPSVTNEFVENARKRAREFQERSGK